MEASRVRCLDKQHFSVLSQAREFWVQTDTESWLGMATDSFESI